MLSSVLYLCCIRFHLLPTLWKENNNTQLRPILQFTTAQDQWHSLPYWKTVGRIYFGFCLSHMSLLLRESNNALCNIVYTNLYVYL